MNDDWKVFGLIPHLATQDDLKKAFRKLAFAHHPDLGGNSARFIEIKDAYDRILCQLDPNSKSSAQKELEEFIKELTEQYFQAFPWRGNAKDALGENEKWNREYVERNRRLRDYLEPLARAELANTNRKQLSFGEAAQKL